MMHRVLLPRAVLLLAASCVLLPRESAAVFCAPDAVHYRYVGDVATDAQCTDDDIQSAIANVTCPNTVIVITGEHTYTAQHLDIGGKDVTLQGTALNCGPPGACGDACPPNPTSPIIEISGSGHSGDSVLYIHGTSHVTIRYLTIRDGANLDGSNPTYGGGIHFDGSGSLSLDTSTVTNNVAMYGGGIAFTGSGGFAGLTLLGHTLITANSAGASGGGIRVDGEAYLSALYDNTLIALNHAPNGYGGGINVVGPAHADIGSPGLGTLGVIYDNDAQHGGGIAVTAGPGSGADAEVQLYTTDPARPVRVYDNFASSDGGGIYLKGYYGVIEGFRHALLCAYDFRIDGNAAPEGSALQAASDAAIDTSSGSAIWLNRFADAPCRGLPGSAVRCAAGTVCNTLADNAAVDAGNNATAGAAIRAEAESTVVADRFALRANHGGYAIRTSGNEFSAQELSNCLLADNEVTQQLVRNEADGLTISGCTFAGNTIGSTDTIHAEGAFTLRNSIIYQPGNEALAFTGYAQDLHAQYALANDVSSLPAGEGVVQGTPAFVDAAHGDYHLRATSAGIDFAPHVAGNDYDLDRQPRDVDLPQRANQYGALDLGAYEHAPVCGSADTVYCDGFESG